MYCDAYTSVIILIVGFIIINNISEEFIFEEKRLNEISENKFSLKITHYTVCVSIICYMHINGHSFVHVYVI